MREYVKEYHIPTDINTDLKKHPLWKIKSMVFGHDTQLDYIYVLYVVFEMPDEDFEELTKNIR